MYKWNSIFSTPNIATQNLNFELTTIFQNSNKKKDNNNPFGRSNETFLLVAVPSQPSSRSSNDDNSFGSDAALHLIARRA